jgi:hypothetical protein
LSQQAKRRLLSALSVCINLQADVESPPSISLSCQNDGLSGSYSASKAPRLAPGRSSVKLSRSPSAVSEARIDIRMKCGQAAPARFRYSDLKEAARRRTRALWGLNGMEGWCASASSCCRGARKTTAGALEFSETQDDRGIKTGEAGKNRFVEAQGTLRLRAPRHAQIS